MHTLVFIQKIVIYNRKKNQSKNLPLNIHLIDDHNNIILTGIKSDYNKAIELANIPPTPPAPKVKELAMILKKTRPASSKIMVQVFDKSI